MSLIELTLRHVSPSYVQTYLGQHFYRTEIMQPKADPIYRFAVACFDGNNRQRLIVLFNWLNDAWQYAIVRPQQVKLKPIIDEEES